MLRAKPGVCTAGWEEKGACFPGGEEGLLAASPCRGKVPAHPRGTRDRVVAGGGSGLKAGGKGNGRGRSPLWLGARWDAAQASPPPRRRGEGEKEWWLLCPRGEGLQGLPGGPAAPQHQGLQRWAWIWGSLPSAHTALLSWGARCAPRRIICELPQLSRPSKWGQGEERRNFPPPASLRAARGSCNAPLPSCAILPVRHGQGEPRAGRCHRVTSCPRGGRQSP